MNQWAPVFFGKLGTLAELADVASDQQNRSATAQLTIDRLSLRCGVRRVCAAAA